MKMYRNALGFSVAVALVGAALASPLAAQTDTRWTPFLGCWAPAGGTSDGSLLCFRSTDSDVGVEMLTVADGEITMTEVFRADGTAQSIEREGCRGSESAEFAGDNRRIYTQSEYTCDGDVTRSATGIMAMVAPNQWVDVRSVGVEGEAVAWVQFYEAAPQSQVEEAGLTDITADRGLAIRSTRMAASVPLTVDQVLDAAEHVDAKAVEAWIAEMRDPFDLAGEDLVALADAGLEESIIDVMVAVSHPEYFALDAQAGPEATVQPQGAGMPVRSAWNRYPYGRYYDPFFFDPFYYGISSRYGYGYSPYGYSRYGGYGWYGGYSYAPVIVTRVQPQSESSRGRVVNGRGYTQGPRAPGGGSGSQPAYNGNAGRSSGGSTAGSSAGSSSTGSSSRGTATGRTARRRGGGGI